MVVKFLGKILKFFDCLEMFKGYYYSVSVGSRIVVEVDIVEFFGEISKKFDGGSEGYYDLYWNGIFLILIIFIRVG